MGAGYLPSTLEVLRGDIVLREKNIDACELSLRLYKLDGVSNDDPRVLGTKKQMEEFQNELFDIEVEIERVKERVIERIRYLPSLLIVLRKYIDSGSSDKDLIFIEPNGAWHESKQGNDETPGIESMAYILTVSNLAEALKSGDCCSILEFINKKLER